MNIGLTHIGGGGGSGASGILGDVTNNAAKGLTIGVGGSGGSGGAGGCRLPSTSNTPPPSRAPAAGFASTIRPESASMAMKP